MGTTQDTRETLQNCLDAKQGVTGAPGLCQHCCARPAGRKYCSGVCRQAAYRRGPAHQANLNGQKERRRERRNRWYARKVRYMALTFDGRYGGYRDATVPRLSEFEKFPS
jgi:hypothetical protein